MEYSKIILFIEMNCKRITMVTSISTDGGQRKRTPTKEVGIPELIMSSVQTKRSIIPI